MEPRARRAPRSSLSDAAYRRLKADILACRMLPGTMLAAAELAERFEMSRTPVHEALKALCQEGFLSVLPRVGYIVTPVTARDIEDIFDLRMTLEVLGAGLAAERATEHDVEKLRSQHEVAKENVASGSIEDSTHLESVIAGNRDFHVAVAQLSGNERLARIIGGLLDEGQRIYFLYFRSHRARPPRDRHVELIHALGNGDAAAAREAMASHVGDMHAGTLAEATATLE